MTRGWCKGIALFLNKATRDLICSACFYFFFFLVLCSLCIPRLEFLSASIQFLFATGETVSGFRTGCLLFSSTWCHVSLDYTIARRKLNYALVGKLSIYWHWIRRLNKAISWCCGAVVLWCDDFLFFVVLWFYGFVIVYFLLLWFCGFMILWVCGFMVVYVLLWFSGFCGVMVLWGCDGSWFCDPPSLWSCGIMIQRCGLCYWRISRFI